MVNNLESDSLLREIKSSLSDAKFPLTKDEAIEWAGKSHASPQAISAIKDMSYSKFYTIDDIVLDYVND